MKTNLYAIAGSPLGTQTMLHYGCNKTHVSPSTKMQCLFTATGIRHTKNYYNRQKSSSLNSSYPETIYHHVCHNGGH